MDSTTAGFCSHHEEHGRIALIIRNSAEVWPLANVTTQPCVTQDQHTAAAGGNGPAHFLRFLLNSDQIFDSTH